MNPKGFAETPKPEHEIVMLMSIAAIAGFVFVVGGIAGFFVGNESRPEFADRTLLSMAAIIKGIFYVFLCWCGKVLQYVGQTGSWKRLLKAALLMNSIIIASLLPPAVPMETSVPAATVASIRAALQTIAKPAWTTQTVIAANILAIQLISLRRRMS